MIHLSYGMLKSASTLAYQVTEEILRQGGRPLCTLPPPLRRALSVTNYFDNIDLALIEHIAAAAQERDVVIKTHQLPAPEVLALIARGQIRATASLRDPREIALSMVDHGARSRRWSIPEFSECRTVFDCWPSLDDQVATLRAWCAVPGVERIAYDDICFDMRALVTRLAGVLGVDVDAAQVARVFDDKMIVGQFNKGVRDRFNEMSALDSMRFLDRYAGFYDAFMPGPRPSNQSFAAGGASGQLRQSLIGLKRLWHSRVGPVLPWHQR